MAENATPSSTPATVDSPPPPASPPPKEAKLAILIIDDPALVDDVITGFLDIGLRGATVIDSQGMGQIVRQEMPIFTGLTSLFGSQTGSRVVLAVIAAEQAEAVFALAKEVGQMADEPRAVICFTLPIDRVQGLKFLE